MEEIFLKKSIDARFGGVGDLAVGLWIAEGARQAGEAIDIVGGGYEPIIHAFGHRTVMDPTSDCMLLGGNSDVYAEELKSSRDDFAPRTLRWQRTMGWDFAPRRPQLQFLSPASYEWAATLVGAQPTVVIAPRAAHTSRSLPVQKWIRVAWALHEEGIRTVAIDRDKDVVHHFPLFAYGFDWTYVLQLVSLAAVVAGNDSGIAHLAVTVGRPTVVTMGPTIGSIVFGHSLDVVRLVTTAELACHGCHFHHAKGYRVACDYGCEALSLISAERIRDEIKTALAVTGKDR
ncbi:MAG: glycosyltransferase family 9 protein [Fimbriimonadaceae bacterium]|nr:glycosyltransferase family 9 protein [Fimbriimonadaceae bacterium]